MLQHILRRVRSWLKTKKHYPTAHATFHIPICRCLQYEKSICMHIFSVQELNLPVLSWLIQEPAAAACLWCVFGIFAFVNRFPISLCSFYQMHKWNNRCKQQSRITKTDVVSRRSRKTNIFWNDKCLDYISLSISVSPTACRQFIERQFFSAGCSPVNQQFIEQMYALLICMKPNQIKSNGNFNFNSENTVLPAKILW